MMDDPEQVALLLASPDAKTLFADLKRIVLDELHALVVSKRGDLMALDLARLRRLAPGVQTVGLSATVRAPPNSSPICTAAPIRRRRSSWRRKVRPPTSPCSIPVSACPGPDIAPATP